MYCTLHNVKYGFVCKTQGSKVLYKITFILSRRRCEDAIKKDLQEIGQGAWTGLMYLRTETGRGFR
jgi:hypothetical protein